MARSSSSTGLRHRTTDEGNVRVGSARPRKERRRLHRSLSNRSPPKSLLNQALLSPQLPPRSRSTQKFFNEEVDVLNASAQRVQPRPSAELLHSALSSPPTRAHERHRTGGQMPSRRVVMKQLKNCHRPRTRQVTPFPLHLNEDFRKLQPRMAFGLGEAGQMEGSPRSPKASSGRSKKPLVKFLQAEFQRPASRQRPPKQSLHLFSDNGPTLRVNASPRGRAPSFENLHQLGHEPARRPDRLSPPLMTSRFRSIVGDDNSDTDSDTGESSSLHDSSISLDGSTGNGFMPAATTVARASPSLQPSTGGRDTASAIWMRRRPGTAFQHSGSMEALSSSPDHSADSPKPAAPSMLAAPAFSAATLQHRPQTNASLNPLLRPPPQLGNTPPRARRPQHVSLLDSEDDEPLQKTPSFNLSRDDSSEADGAAPDGSPFHRGRDNSSDGEGLCNTSLTSAFLDLFGT